MSAALNNWWGNPHGDMANAAQAGADELAQDMTPGQGGLLGFLEGIPVIGGLISDVVDPLRGVLGQAGGMIEGLALGWGLGGVVEQTLEPAFASVIYSSHRAALDARIDANTAAGLQAQGIMTAAQAEAEAHDLGFDPNRTEQLYQAAITYPDVSVLLDMLNRGLLPRQDFVLAMQRHGYDLSWIEPVRGLARNLLGPADLALGWLRGDVDDATLNSYGANLGMTQADMQILVANTGEPPGLEELMSMWRRQIIDQPTFERGVRQSRVRNEWIPHLEQAIYTPMSVADAARAVVEHYLDMPTAQVIANQNGLEPTHFPYIVESWGRPLSRTEMSELYHRGLATRAQFDQAMRESDLKDKYTGQAFDLARVLIPARQVVTALQHGALDGPTAISYLMEQGYSQQDAQTLVTTGQAEHHAGLKELSKSDIQTLYTDKLISRADATAKLEFLGYSAEVAGWILHLAEARHQASLYRTTVSQTRALYLKRDIDRAEARSKLQAAGVADQDASALIDEWDLLHGTPTRTLSESQTVKAAEATLISVPAAHDRLMAIGYDDRDAHLLLELAGFTPGMIAGTEPFPPPAPVPITQPGPGTPLTG